MTARKQVSIRAQFRREGLDIRSVAGAAREINRLIGELRREQNRRLVAEQDSARIGWLEANAPHELRLLRLNGTASVCRWWTRYVSFHSWQGNSLREAIDEAIRTAPAASRASVVAPEPETR